MELPGKTELVRHCVNQIMNRPFDWVDPIPVHHVENMLPESVLSALRKLPVMPKDMTGARAHKNADRFYFSESNRKLYPVVQLLAEVFQSDEVVAAITKTSDGQLDDCHLLMELSCDAGESVLVPHRDIGTKRFTGLFYVSNDPALATAGTDFYTPRADCLEAIVEAARENGDAPRELFEVVTKRPVYGPGRGYYFIPSDVSWHGFDRRRIEGERKTLIVNYLGETRSGERYRNVQNLCFQDKTVKVRA